MIFFESVNILYADFHSSVSIERIRAFATTGIGVGDKEVRK